MFAHLFAHGVCKMRPVRTATAIPEAILTLDVEDWEHANFAQLHSYKDQIRTEVRARRYAMDSNTDTWIHLLGESGATSTCFVLGEFAQRYPDAVKRLAQAGHEIGSHGATHDLIHRMTHIQFREFLKKGLGTIGDLTGHVPRGFRAPSWSVDPVRTPWFAEELALQNVHYDSSLFPVKTPLFGQGSAPLSPFWEGSLLRVPVSVLSFGSLRIPFASGAFFRLCPLWLIEAGLMRAIRQGLPAMIVLHPRELDPLHPRLPLRGWEKSVHYARLETTIPKLRRLLSRFRWRSVLEHYGNLIGRSL